MYRLIQFLRSSGGSAKKGSQATTSLSIEESYKILGLKKGCCSKEDVLKTAAKLQKKIHPDMNRDVNTERLKPVSK